MGKIREAVIEEAKATISKVPDHVLAKLREEGKVVGGGFEYEYRPYSDIEDDEAELYLFYELLKEERKATRHLKVIKGILLFLLIAGLLVGVISGIMMLV